MIRRFMLLTVIVIGTVGAVASGIAGPATPEARSTLVECPITQPNDVTPPASGNAFGAGWGDYGNEYLWTSLWIWGPGAVWVPDDGHLTADGVAQGMKWAWYRFVEGDLSIEGRRLDADAPPLEAHVPNGSYGVTGFVATGITFPTDGCWEITGTIGEHSLTFVVLVLYPPDYSGMTPPWATPVATPA